MALGAVSPLCACTTLIPGTMPHDLHRDAVALEHDRCDPTPVDPRLYGTDIVQKVEPYYRYVMGGPNGREARFAGAELHVRPLPGVTAELLERGLSCRAAQLVLGHAEPAPNEPYFLPDGWVKVEVRSGGGSFVVSLSGEDWDRGHTIYARARAFVSRPPPAP
jgi:hypothetical protein